ncbi:MAG: nucleotidyltransferase family protein, partial [Flavobacterium sp.]
MQKSIGIIILAAGSSSRIGHPKQLLQYEGKTLLSHTVAQAMAVNETAVIVVTGANDVMITTELKNTGAMSVY